MQVNGWKIPNLTGSGCLPPLDSPLATNEGRGRKCREQPGPTVLETVRTCADTHTHTLVFATLDLVGALKKPSPTNPNVEEKIERAIATVDGRRRASRQDASSPLSSLTMPRSLHLVAGLQNAFKVVWKAHRARLKHAVV